jgi:hypothetical protein
MPPADEFIEGTLVPKNLLEPLGHLSAWYSLAEEAINEALILFFDLDDQRGRLLMAQLSGFKAKVAFFENLARLQVDDEAQFTELQTRLKALKDASDERNFIVHGTWSYPALIVDPGIPKARPSRRGNTQMKFVTPGKIMEAAKAMQEATHAFNDALNGVRRTPIPAPLKFSPVLGKLLWRSF